MRRMVIGGIGAIWGIGVLVYSLRSAGEYGGSYGAGRMFATLAGGAMGITGFVFFVIGLSSLNDSPTRGRSRGGRRRYDDDEDDDDRPRRRRAGSDGVPGGAVAALVVSVLVIVS